MNAIDLLLLPAGAAVGAFVWTFDEYLMHRFAMHELKGKGLASREHLRHHAERDSILEKWPIAWTGIILFGLLLLRPVATWLVGPAFGWAAGVSFVGAYGFYDYMHWRAHRRPIRLAYEQRLRRRHFTHHFHTPMRNHGVTTSLWDKVFGTYEEVDVIRVPRRLAMVWLTDEQGNVKPEYAGDYRVAGSRTLDDNQRQDDRVRAYANLAPAV